MDYSVRYQHWRQFDSLAISELVCMRRGIDPELEGELPNWANTELSHEIELLVAAVHAGTVDVRDPLGGAITVRTRVIRNVRLIDWLREKGWDNVANGLSTATPSQPHSTASAPVSRHRAQESAILAELARQGHNPRALPKAPQGGSGVKANVKRALGNAGMWAGTTVFDKAWDRLRASGAIS